MSIHRDGKVWRVRWRENGRHRNRTFDRKGDAEAWDREVRRRQQLGALVVQQLTDRGPTLGEWISERWAPEHGDTLARRTRDRYAVAYEIHLAPWLDEVPLREITVSRLRAWQADRLKNGASVESVRKARTFLSSVLRHAAESEVITSNPVSLVRAPRKEHKDEIEPLSPRAIESIRAALAAALNTSVPEGQRMGSRRRAYDMPEQRDAVTKLRDATLVSVLAYAGLRPSEAAGLRWSDVRERTLLVQRSADSDGSIKSTKGRKTRSVKILSPLQADLREWRLASGRPGKDALLFPRADGEAWTSIDWGNWRNRTWRKACTAAELADVPRIYDLRHSFASLLLAQGKSIHYVAGQLGHSPTETLETYGHVLAEFEDAERVDPEAEIAAARQTNVPREFHELADQSALDSAP